MLTSGAGGVRERGTRCRGRGRGRGQGGGRTAEGGDVGGASRSGLRSGSGAASMACGGRRESTRRLGDDGGDSRRALWIWRKWPW